MNLTIFEALFQILIFVSSTKNSPAQAKAYEISNANNMQNPQNPILLTFLNFFLFGQITIWPNYSGPNNRYDHVSPKESTYYSSSVYILYNNGIKSLLVS